CGYAWSPVDYSPDCQIGRLPCAHNSVVGASNSGFAHPNAQLRNCERFYTNRMSSQPLTPQSNIVRSWHGLTDREAAERLQAEGPNQLPSEKPRTLAAVALEVVREPMFLLLIGTGIVYLLLGDPQETMALLVAIFI